MKRNTMIALGAVAAMAAVAAAGFGMYRVGMQRGMTMGAPTAAAAAAAAPTDYSNDIAAGEAATRRHMQQGLKAGQVDPANGATIAYYHDPMVPGKRFDAPAKSPFMDMMLVPVYGGGQAQDNGTVTISPRVQQNLGVRTAAVAEGEVGTSVATVGQVAWNERDQSVVSARADGYVEKVFVRAALDRVRAGQPMAEIYVPAWVAAQEEFLALRRMQGRDMAVLVDGARARMRQAGMTEAQIAPVEASGSLQPRVAVVAPQAGVVTELMLREGMTVSAGMPLARIAGLSSVWVEAEVPETQAALVQPGARVVGSTAALPGERFNGVVKTLLPQVDATTRTLRARVELANPKGRLTPGLFVHLDIAPQARRKVLRIPSQAVIATGERFIVMLAEADGAFRPAEIEPGVEAGGYTEVRRGLRAGQQVVESGQFLIDSESSLRAAVDRFASEDARKPQALEPGETAAGARP
jgi:Cu(I)/Ag(I) efflux system membrane fusion protein